MSSAFSPAQGEIWDINFSPVIGHEQGGRRPALVISNNRFNSAANQLCVVVPLTTRQRGLPSEIVIDPPEGGVTARSIVLAQQLRTVSHDRLETKRGWVSGNTLSAVLQVVQAVVSESTRPN